MDIDKLVNEALYEFHSDMSTQVQSAVDRELDAVREYNNEFGEEETSLSESLLMTALPAALSAGIGALNMRRTLAKSSNLNEVDWEEMAGKAGKVAGKVGDWAKNKAEEGATAGKGALKVAKDYWGKKAEEGATAGKGALKVAKDYWGKKAEEGATAGKTYLKKLISGEPDKNNEMLKHAGKASILQAKSVDSDSVIDKVKKVIGKGAAKASELVDKHGAAAGIGAAGAAGTIGAAVGAKKIIDKVRNNQEK